MASIKSELVAGDLIDLENGGTASVIRELGRGGQGIVYLVKYNGKEYALKWYFYQKLKNPDEFRANLKQNVEDGSPEGSDKFIWPLYLTRKQKGTFGYLMDVAPAGYVEMDKVYAGYEWKNPHVKGQNGIKVTYRFKTLESKVNAAINIVNAFRTLHSVGKSYQDLNGGGFLINLETGDVLICDCDNVAPDGKNFGVGGFPGFMAPEIVRGVAKPDVLTDRYSLAVVLFRLFMRADPLEGKKVFSSVCLTEAKDLKYYGKEPLFIFDPNDESNRPLRGHHDNAIKGWQLYPQYILDAFTKSFTEGISNPNTRIIEKKWQELLIRLRTDIVHCSCGHTTFANLFIHKKHFEMECRKCGSKIYLLALNNNKRTYGIPVYPGLKLYKCDLEKSDDYSTISGEIVENKVKRGIYGIKNLSDNTWVAKLPDGSEKEILPGKGVPIWRNLSVDFRTGVIGKIMS